MVESGDVLQLGDFGVLLTVTRLEDKFIIEVGETDTGIAMHTIIAESRAKAEKRLFEWARQFVAAERH